jgi:hypothetical protein
MKAGTVQAVLSISIVVSFLAVTAVLALVPIIGGYPPAQYTEHLRTYTTVFSGVIGVIVGFYFGRTISQSDA